MAKNRVQVQGVSAPKLGNSIGGVGQTFIQPSQTEATRGLQIAQALGQASGTLQQTANMLQQKKTEEVRLVDGIKAKNAYGVLSPSLIEHISNQDYSITEREDGERRRATADEMFASWANTEEYQGQLSQFGSESAKRAFEGSMQQAVAETYGKAAVEFDQRELRDTLTQELQVGLMGNPENKMEAVRLFDERLRTVSADGARAMSNPEATQACRSARSFRGCWCRAAGDRR